MRSLSLIFLLLVGVEVIAQEREPESLPEIQQQLELDTEENEMESEDDSYLQQLRYYLKHPINLNEASAEELNEFKILSALQISNFVSYRNLFGRFVSIYELQAIPAWDITVIKKILPYIIISGSTNLAKEIRERLWAGDKDLLFRLSMTTPKSKGYLERDSAGKGYAGSRPQLLIRYTYNYRNLLQYGILAEKDAGEELFRGSQKRGFDFYSFHLFLRKAGIIQSLAIGDFTVNFGQGLIHWQRLAFKKSASIGSVKRQTAVLHPYSSAGEYNFHRGAGITLSRRRFELTVFGSTRKVSASIQTDSVTSYVTSLSKSGYHRSSSEIKNRNTFRFIAAGGNLTYKFGRGGASFNAVQHLFSTPFTTSHRPYDIFSFTGKRSLNLSVNGEYTVRNSHFFAEVAWNREFRLATLAGVLASIDQSVDFALLFRKISPEYQSFHGNAFTESSLPSNETGLYTGLSIRPFQGLKMDAYCDLFQFRWLLFRTNAPSYGCEYVLQFEYVPNRSTEISVRYKRETKETNESASHIAVLSPIAQLRKSVRYDVSYRARTSLILRHRVEAVWFDKGPQKGSGFLAYMDAVYKPFSKSVSGNARIQYFETDGYDSRIYAYENDVLFSSSTPAFFDSGFRLYVNLQTNVSKWQLLHEKLSIKISAKYSLTHFFKLDKIGSELNEIQGKNRSDFKLQILVSR